MEDSVPGDFSSRSNGIEAPFLFFSIRSPCYRCPERALDTHIYQAWKDPDSRIGFFKDACNNKQAILNLEREFGPVIVGEWSLATE